MSQETIRKLAERIEFKLRPAIASGKNVLQIRVIEVEMAPFGALLEAAQTATEVCDEDDNCKICRLRAALSDIQKG